jgi:hypothetical protein
MPPGSTAQLLWSHPMLSSMQKQAQATAQLSLCSLSAVSMKGSRHNVAVLASAPDGTLALQLLSKSPKTKPEELSTHILDVSEAGPTADSSTEQRAKWRCCCGQKLEVLIWRESGSAYRWTVETGEPRIRHAQLQSLSSAESSQIHTRTSCLVQHAVIQLCWHCSRDMHCMACQLAIRLQLCQLALLLIRC